MSIIPLILIILADPGSARLTLIPNTMEILQRDNLLLMAVLENKSESTIRVFSQPGLEGDICLELREGDKWVIHHTVRGDGIGPAWQLLDGKSTHAELKILFDSDDRFFFEMPGKYELRAVAKMPWGDMHSKSIAVTVKERSKNDLKLIRDAKVDFSLTLRGHGAVPGNIIDLRSVGGNIGRTIDDRRMTRAIADAREWRGESVPKEKACEWLRMKLDPVSAEQAVQDLGWYYVGTKNWDGVYRVVAALKHDSTARREFVYRLQLIAKPPEIPGAP